MPLSKGDKLGPYEIIAPIGAGGMGEVWKARDTRPNRFVALKRLVKTSGRMLAPAVFALYGWSAAAQSTIITTLVTFNGTDGSFPIAGLAPGVDGNLYGTTFSGGADGYGTVFKMTPAGALTSMHSFNGADGSRPEASVVQGTDGNFYGTTSGGGANNGAGTVYRITPGGTLTTLYSFCSQVNCADGYEPNAGLVQGADGNFYGTTYQDGAHSAGTVYQITPRGTLTTLYSFTGGSDGYGPLAALVQGADGNFYGTTSGLGTNPLPSTAFKITPRGALTTLYSFANGELPEGALAQGADGNFYGTTVFGGTYGYGAVFRLTPGGTLTTLHSFNVTDGAYPYAGLVQGADGNFYGTTSATSTSGKSIGYGTVFKITPGGTLTTLYSFCSQFLCIDGASPYSRLVQGLDGNLYGTTYTGGASSDGAVFRLAISSGSTLQTITFGALSNQMLGTTFFVLSASASSGLAVTFGSNTTAVCTVSGVTVRLVAVGTCSITASQAGNANYAAATPVTQSFTVSSATGASLSVNPTALNFYVQPGASAQSQSLQISGTAGAAWQATATTLTGGAWLSVSPGAGQIPASFTALANPGGLTAGTYQGSITIQAPGATPSSSTIDITLVVAAASGQGAIITTVAGNGAQTFSGDDGPATSASLIPFGVTVDASGSLFIADAGNNRIRKVSATGVITTVAGSGPFAYGGGSFSGDGGPAIAASLNNPSGVAVDASGNLFIADAGNYRIRKVSASGIITTVAGNGSFCFLNSPGDGGPATAASVCPSGVAVDGFGNIFIADTGNNRIRKVPASGIITTVAGGGNSSFSGDGGPATAASLSAPTGVAVDAAGNLFIADSDNNRIRKVSAGGIITTVAGSGSVDVFSGSSGSFSHSGGFSGDGGQATSALLSTPTGVAVDASGNFFIADSDNNRVRKVSASGIITTVAGSGNFGLVNTGPGFTSTGSFSGDGGPATSATLANPFGVAVNASGNLFIADDFNYRIREVQMVNALAAIQNSASYATGAVSPGEIVVLYSAGLGPSALATSQVDGGTGLLQTNVAGTTVLFNDTPAALLYTSANQVSAIVPYEVAGSATAEILVNYQGQNVAAGAVTVAPAAPGIFTVNSGTGQAAALNHDGTINSVSNPAAAGSVIVLYLTGEGQTVPPGVDGKIATAAPYPAPVMPVTVAIGGQPATYAYAGAAPGEVAGVMQINASIPMGVAGSAVPVSVQVGTASTQIGVTIAVQ